jgi:DNA processing protein
MNDLVLARLRLARTAGVGPRTARLLEERCGAPTEIFARSYDELRALGVPTRLARALVNPLCAREAKSEFEEHERLGHVLRPLEELPEALASIHDPPQVLSYRGRWPSHTSRCVAIVGARRATREGREIAYHLALELAAAGVVVVSGLARGIDTAAHEGALEAGGHTLAVLGSGLADVYPRRNRDLAEQIVAREGAVISELAPHAPPRRHTFPQRNRIVTGLSWGVVVVQAGPRSGALLSAEMALSQGRELFAVPGSIREALSQGPNALLRDGAHLVAHARDVLDLLDGVESQPEEEPPIGPLARRLLDLLHEDEQHELQLSTGAGVSPEAVGPALGELLVWGLARRTPGGYALR